MKRKKENNKIKSKGLSWERRVELGKKSRVGKVVRKGEKFRD
jgi:hypothetical protein